MRKIERGASGRWMRRLTQAVVASDGSLALLDASHGLNATDVWFHVFDEVGDAISSVELPSSCQFASLAYDGRRIALQSQKCVIFFGLDGKPRGKVSLDDSAEVLGIAFSPRGELWLVNGDGIRRWCVK